MSTTTRERCVVAVSASLVLSLFILLSLSSAVMATTGNPMEDTVNMPGTINVYGHANPGGTFEYGDGNEVSAGGETLGGVPFTLYKAGSVGLVNGNAGWDVVGKITNPAKSVESALDNQNSSTKVTIDGKEHTLKKIDERTTVDGMGPVQFADVYPGLHVVIESKASLPPGSVIVARVAPFFITLPVKDAKGTWSCTANIYPKNTVSPKPEESVEVENVADGMITWTMKQTLPTFGDTDKLTRFRFGDDLSGTGDTKGTLVSVKITVNGKDKTGDFSKGLAGLDGKHLVIVARNPGDLPSDREITATYITKASGNGQFRNGVLSFINDVEIGHALTFVDLSEITVGKLDATDKTLHLNGTESEVCVDEDGVEETKDCPTVGMITTEKSLGAGSLDKLKIQEYVLFETVAPAGYTSSLGTSYKADLAMATYNTVTLTIENAKMNMSTLPLTGVDGQLLMIIGGVAFVPLAGGVFLVAYKKRSEE